MPVGVTFRGLLASGAVGAAPWDVIDSTTLGSAAASISFASIDSKYKLFRVTAYVVKDATAHQATLRINNDSGANYDYQRLNGSSTTVSAARVTGQTSILLTPTETIAANSIAQFSIIIGKQIAGSAAMVLSDGTFDATSVGRVKADIAARWNNTADLINRIDLISSSGNFAAGTVVVLEGLPD